MSDGEEKRGLVGRFLRWVLVPVYYYLDLNGPDGKPQHNKVKTTGVLIVVTAIVLRLAWHIMGDLDTDPHAIPELTTLTTLCVFIVCASYGLAGLRIWADTKNAPPPSAGPTIPGAH